MKYGLVGFSGKMGKEIIEVFSEYCHQLVAKFDRTHREVQEKPDIILDFSSPEALKETVELSKKFLCPAVIGTTNLKEQDISMLNELSALVPVVYSSNFSVGINVIKNILESFKLEFSEWDIEIIEFHHRKKKDAPSGTALFLSESLGNVPIHSIRAGGIFGDHKILFANEGEVIELSHRAMSRKIFALGALKAAEFAISTKASFYTFRDVLSKKR